MSGNTLQGQDAQWFRQHAETIHRLPREGGCTVHAWPVDEPHWLREKLREYDLIESVGNVEMRGKVGARCTNVYRFTDRGRELLDRYDVPDTGVQMPCGHSGFSNLQDSPFYQCTTCGGRFTREEVEQSRQQMRVEG